MTRITRYVLATFFLALPVLCGCMANRQATADLLAHCRQACQGGRGEVTLERRGWQWQATHLALDADLTAETAAAVADLTTLESLEVNRTQAAATGGLQRLVLPAPLARLREIRLPDSVTPDGVFALRALPGLRKINVPRSAAPAVLYAISLLGQVEDLEVPILRGGARETFLAGVAGFPRLRALDLTTTGTDDETLSHLTAIHGLQELRLGMNGGITDRGLPAIAGLTELRVLELHCTGVTDKGLRALGGLTHLRRLWLNGSQVTAQGMAALRGLPHLEELAVGGYKDYHLPGFGAGADFSPLVSLKSLDIGWLAPGESAGVRLPPGLKRLVMPVDMAGNTEILRPLKNMEFVRVYMGSDDEADLRGLEGLRNLQTVCFFGNHDTAVRALAPLRLPALRAVVLEAGWASLSDQGLAVLGGMQGLESLKVEAAPEIDDRGLVHLARLKNLRELVLDNLQRVPSSGLGFLRALTRLERLEVCSVPGHEIPADSILRESQTLSNLEELTLSGGRITDEGLACLSGLKHLRKLDLGGCHGFSDEALLNLMQSLPDLKVVTRSYE